MSFLPTSDEIKALREETGGSLQGVRSRLIRDRLLREVRLARFENADPENPRGTVSAVSRLAVLLEFILSEADKL